ncbi:MAG: HAMP domain-containing protein, partial [Gammaproteobacteria bacterium]|nr:HAMP domain-containing protein [Gammaproteobacteria bacterium]
MTRTSISGRIRRALLGLALGLSILFSLLAVLLLYITEDKIFVNQLLEERADLASVSPLERNRWQPANRHIEIYWDLQQLSPTQRDALEDPPGVYEYFDGQQAFFILRDTLKSPQREYFLAYDVSSLVAVRQSRPVLFTFFGIAATLFLVSAVFVARHLTRLTLRPLRELTDNLAIKSAGELPKDFAARFRGDEVGLLAEALADALAKVQESAKREFEFNQGVSHELRSPIQVAKNATELLSNTGFTGENRQLQEPVNRLTRAVEQMENITEAFL